MTQRRNSCMESCK